MDGTKLHQWVEIERILLQPEQRLANVPADTKGTPLTMRVAGFLVTDGAKLGDVVEITTTIGRRWQGKLVSDNPRPSHGFGPPVPELQRIGPALRQTIKEGVSR